MTCVPLAIVYSSASKNDPDPLHGFVEVSNGQRLCICGPTHKEYNDVLRPGVLVWCVQGECVQGEGVCTCICMNVHIYTCIYMYVYVCIFY